MPPIPQWFYWVFAGLLILFLVNVMDVAIPFIASAAIAWFLNIYAEFFEKKGMKRLPAVILSLTTCVVAVAVAFLFIIPPLANQIYQINNAATKKIAEIHQAGIQKKAAMPRENRPRGPQSIAQSAQELFSTYITGVYEKYPYLKNQIGDEKRLYEIFKSKQQEIASSILKFLNDAVLNISSFMTKLFNLILIPIFTCYFLAVFPDLRRRLDYVLGKVNYGQDIRKLLHDVIGMLESYVRGMAIVMVLFGTAVGTGCWILSLFTGAKYSLFIGCLSGLLCIVPYVGLILIMITAVTIAILTTGNNIIAGVLTLVVIFIINFMFDNFLSPRIVGKFTGLHPLISIFAMLAVGKIFGFWGLILGVPCAATVKIIMMKLYPVLFEPIDKDDEMRKKNKKEMTEGRNTAPKKQENTEEKAEAETEPEKAEARTESGNDGRNDRRKEKRQERKNGDRKNRTRKEDEDNDSDGFTMRIPSSEDLESPFTMRETQSEKKGPEIMHLKTFKAITRSLLPPKKKDDTKKRRNKKSRQEHIIEESAPVETGTAAEKAAENPATASIGDSAEVRTAKKEQGAEQRKDSADGKASDENRRKKRSRGKSARGDEEQAPQNGSEASNDSPDAEAEQENKAVKNRQSEKSDDSKAKRSRSDRRREKSHEKTAQDGGLDETPASSLKEPERNAERTDGDGRNAERTDGDGRNAEKDGGDSRNAERTDGDGRNAERTDGDGRNAEKTDGDGRNAEKTDGNSRNGAKKDGAASKPKWKPILTNYDLQRLGGNISAEAPKKAGSLSSEEPNPPGEPADTGSSEESRPEPNGVESGENSAVKAPKKRRFFRFRRGHKGSKGENPEQNKNN